MTSRLHTGLNDAAPRSPPQPPPFLKSRLISRAPHGAAALWWSSCCIRTDWRRRPFSLQSGGSAGTSSSAKCSYFTRLAVLFYALKRFTPGCVRYVSLSVPAGWCVQAVTEQQRSDDAEVSTTPPNPTEPAAETFGEEPFLSN